MMKTVFITEKPSVAQDYKKYLQVTPMENTRGYIEGFSPVLNKNIIITWAEGHLCTMSYPEKYDLALRKWSMESLPFLPSEYKYEVIDGVRQQFDIVKTIFNRNDIEAIFYAGDSAREGIYIMILIRRLANIKSGVDERVVWINSVTEREIVRGIQEAKPLSDYQNLIDAAYMRAIEDYSIGINFSRAMSLRFGQQFNKHIAASKYTPIAVGRVMSCVLGMVVEREREIKSFEEETYYKVTANTSFESEWKVTDSSFFYNSPHLHNEKSFKEYNVANMFVSTLSKNPILTVSGKTVKVEKSKAPYLFNLADLQNFCSKKYHLSPDQTLSIAQTLYEKKLITYPRTDARVLSSSVANEIYINLNGIAEFGYKYPFVSRIAENNWHMCIVSTSYVDDSKISDHYAIIPTGDTEKYEELNDLMKCIFCDIIDRFLCIFYPPCISTKTELELSTALGECFYSSEKTVKSLGYTEILDEHKPVRENTLLSFEKGAELTATFDVKFGKTSPPVHYTSGSMILAMENAGKMIEDEVARALMKDEGIGTPATRADIIKKLINIGYLELNKRNQNLTATHTGECVYDILNENIPLILSPETTTSWEKGLSEIENGTVEAAEYRKKLEQFISQNVTQIKEAKSISFTYPAEESTVQNDGTESILCPKCGQGNIITSTKSKSWFCTKYSEGCNFSIWKIIANKELTRHQIAALCRDKKTGIIKGFTKQTGEPFKKDACLKLQDDFTVEFYFPRQQKKEMEADEPEN